MEEHWNPKAPPQHGGVGSADAEKGVDDIEAAAAVLSSEARRQPAQLSSAPSDVLHRCAQQLPSPRLRLLLRCEDVDFVRLRKALDQPETRRNDTIDAVSVHPTRQDDRDLHRGRATPKRELE